MVTARTYIAVLSAVALLTLPGAAATATLGAPQRVELVNKYCIGCHQDRLKSGGFSFSTLDPAHPDGNAEQAEKIIRKLRTGMMPPAGQARPDAKTLEAFT